MDGAAATPPAEPRVPQLRTKHEGINENNVFNHLVNLHGEIGKDLSMLINVTLMYMLSASYKDTNPSNYYPDSLALRNACSPSPKLLDQCIFKNKLSYRLLHKETSQYR